MIVAQNAEPACRRSGKTSRRRLSQSRQALAAATASAPPQPKENNEQVDWLDLVTKNNDLEKFFTH